MANQKLIFVVVTKTACGQAIAMGENVRCSSDCVSFLNTKFYERYISPSYSVSNIAEETLDDRKVKQYKKFECVNGSDSFHMIDFRPNQSFFYASNKLCTCVSM